MEVTVRCNSGCAGMDGLTEFLSANVKKVGEFAVHTLLDFTEDEFDLLMSEAVE